MRSVRSRSVSVATAHLGLWSVTLPTPPQAHPSQLLAITFNSTEFLHWRIASYTLGADFTGNCRQSPPSLSSLARRSPPNRLLIGYEPFLLDRRGSRRWGGKAGGNMGHEVIVPIQIERKKDEDW